jgi:hypothetical protein
LTDRTERQKILERHNFLAKKKKPLFGFFGFGLGWLANKGHHHVSLPA